MKLGNTDFTMSVLYIPCPVKNLMSFFQKEEKQKRVKMSRREENGEY